MQPPSNTNTPRRFYVLIGEQQKGPFTEQESRDLRYAGTVTPQTLCWEEGTPDWVPFERLSFQARDIPPRPSLVPPPPVLEPKSETLGYIIALAPAAVSVVAGLYVSSAGASQSTFRGLVGATILGTNLLMMFEAYKLGMGKRQNGKRTVGPIRWLLNAMVLWVVAIPCYLHARRKFGRKNFVLLGIISMIVFVITFFSIGSTFTEREMAARPVGNMPSTIRPTVQSNTSSDGTIEEQSRNQIRKVYLACRLFAGDSDGNFPGKLSELVPNYLEDYASLSSPLASTQGEVDYLYAGGTDTDAPDKIFLMDRNPMTGGLHWVVYINGNTQAIKPPAR